VVAAIFSFFANDRFSPGRPAALPLVLFADMHRDSLITVTLLFELRFCPTAPPLLKAAASIADTSAFSFWRPSPHLSFPFSSFFCADPPAAFDFVNFPAFFPGSFRRALFLVRFSCHC